jgi:hypothetical protein
MSIRSLSFLYLEGYTIESSIEHLDAPNLRTFHARNVISYRVSSNCLDLSGMRGVSEAMEGFGGSLSAFIERDGNELQTLCLDCSSIPDAFFLHILTSTRTLRHLHLIDSFVNEPLMLSLAQDPSWPTCPMLESITLQSCLLLSGMVIDLIRSRQSGPSPIGGGARRHKCSDSDQ